MSGTALKHIHKLSDEQVVYGWLGRNHLKGTEGDSVNVLQIQQSHHQSSGFSETPPVGMIQSVEPVIELAPVDQIGQPHQFMVYVDLAVKAASEQFALVSISG